MTETRFPDAPPNIAALKVEARGYPTPWFVPWIGGEPEFRAIHPEQVQLAVQRSLLRDIGTARARVIEAMRFLDQALVTAWELQRRSEDAAGSRKLVGRAEDRDGP
jgi:hypothetical protein